MSGTGYAGSNSRSAFIFIFFDKPSWLFLEWPHQFALPTPLPVFAVISYLGDCHSELY